MNIMEQKLEKAISFHSKGNYKEAEKIYSQILVMRPNDVDVLYLYGILASQSQNSNRAIELLQKALDSNPTKEKIKEIYGVLAEIYTNQNNDNQAMICHNKILEIAPYDLAANFNLGNLFFNQQDIDQSIECYKKALYADAYCIDVYYNLVAAYKIKNDTANVILCYKKMLEIEPNEASFYFELGISYGQKGEAESSIKSYINAIQLKPDYTEACINLANIYHQLCFYDLALEYNQKALAINPNFVEVYNNMGNVYVDTKDVDKAINISKEGLKLFPQSEPLKFNLARAQMLAGNVEEAWDYYKYRRIINERKGLGPYLLDYNGPLKGKTIYVYWDTGLGDTIQFVRYLPLLSDLGAKVLFKPQAALETIMSESNLKVEIIPDSMPDREIKYDYQINLISLPYLFKTDINNFPFKDKFLRSNTEKTKWYKENYFNNDKFKVGLVWQASNLTTIHTFKSVTSVNEFLAFAELQNVQLYSLQKGKAEEQLKNLPDGFNIIDIGSTFKDFSDTAAAIENLDLLISVDTSVVHLAGALGKPVWNMMTYVPNWRWFLDRSDCPWYESMRLFRQSSPNTWKDVIENMLKAFQEMR